jgi:hypothetical protein
MRALTSLLLIAFSYSAQAEIGIGWLGPYSQLSLEWTPTNSHNSFTLACGGGHSENANVSTNNYSGGPYYSQTGNKSFSGNVDLYYLRNIELITSAKRSVAVTVSPFCRVGYSYRKTILMQSIIYEDKSDQNLNRYTESASIRHVVHCDLGLRPEIRICQRVSFVCFFGATFSFDHSVLDVARDIQNNSYNVDLFGDSRKSSDMADGGVPLLTDLSVIFWFGKHNDASTTIFERIRDSRKATQAVN